MNDLVRLSDASADGVRTLVLARPDKANALSADLVEQLHAALDRIGTETRTLLIRGEGRHFCAGFDFSDVERQSAGDLLLRFVRINELLVRLRTAAYPTIAWVHGAAYGAGADIVCACAIRIAAGPVRMRFPGFGFGVALGTRRLAAIAGHDAARRILLLDRELDREAALQAGLLTDRCDDADPDIKAAEWVAATCRLDAAAWQALQGLTDADDHDADLAALVRSVARPGLHARIAAYRAA